MNKQEIVQVLEDIALLLEIQGENAFKVRAYQTAANALANLDEELDLLIEEGRLEEIEGIGKSIADKIQTLVLQGRLPYFEKLKKSMPLGLLELIRIPELGAKKVKKIYDELGIHSLKALYKACQNQELSELKGFGPKTEKNILKNIENLEAYGKRMLWWMALQLAIPIKKGLVSLKDVEDVEVAGSFRRGLETVGDLDFLVASNNPSSVMKWFTTQELVESVQSRGKTKSSVRLEGGLQADLRVVPKEEFPYALLYFTGSKEFSVALRQRANRLGYSLNEYGLMPKKGKKKPECKSEKGIFRALKLAYIPPELREGLLEIKVAEEGELPKLIEEKDIRGVFHCHTTDSDGHNTILEMALAAEELGWEYLGISDHSKSSTQANGMDADRLFEQIERIRTLNRSKKIDIHLFAGLECDILRSGKLDFSDDILKELDFVVASVHRSFKLDEASMTTRIIKAVENPYTTMIGHLTGRLLLRREPYLVNIPKVIDACIANGKIIELNAHPNRLDMDWRYWQKAAEKGLICSINPDAHRASDLEFYIAGINSARKGWLEKKHVFNTQSLSKVKKYLKEGK